MDAKQLVEQLTGSVQADPLIGSGVRDSLRCFMEYPPRIPGALLKLAKESRLVIVYGASDDLLEFEGAIQDEVGCYEGCTALVDKEGLVPDNRELVDKAFTQPLSWPSDDEALHHWLHRKQNAKTITALWCAEPDIAWTIKTDIPHETFNVMEDGEIYGRGIVFSLDQLGGVE